MNISKEKTGLLLFSFSETLTRNSRNNAMFLVCLTLFYLRMLAKSLSPSIKMADERKKYFFWFYQKHKYGCYDNFNTLFRFFSFLIDLLVFFSFSFFLFSFFFFSSLFFSLVFLCLSFFLRYEADILKMFHMGKISKLFFYKKLVMKRFFKKS